MSLGRTQEKYGDFLSPLVEPCLPEEVLVAWKRRRNQSLKETKGYRTLEQLMNFLRQEVKGEEIINLARTGFASYQSSRRKEFHNEQLKQYETTAAAALVSLQTPVDIERRRSKLVNMNLTEDTPLIIYHAEQVSDYDEIIQIFFLQHVPSWNSNRILHSEIDEDKPEDDCTE
ncbi:hypothetical protein AVEN_262951-1 [Araneus ventricosus]|uniref:Uncharacterized protein n=1 Tax=Araneus ventricosus TaxID=182803 RepID=A0A4Y2DHW3_ARAVE|nr:hypothetical protein AVEN_262951-1 [Araneus ventricosus]